MKLTSRAGLTAGAVAAALALLLLPLQPARAGTAADPEVQDAAGDANVLAVQNQKLATPPASAAPYDVLSTWFAGGGAINIKLAAPPAAVGIYQVSFDAPGCAVPPSAPLPADTSAVFDDHTPSGVGIAVDIKANLPTAYYVCNVSGTTWGVTYVPVRINGSIITITIPATGKLTPGMAIKNPYALTAAAPSTVVDMTFRGRAATL